MKRLLSAALVLLSALAPASQADTAAATRHTFLKALVAAARERAYQTVRYDPGYMRIGYPGGDVPPDAGVCKDEVIRSYRAVGIDLQVEVHKDIVAHFRDYPASRIWRQRRPDTNIDHRRVPNLMMFFEHKGEHLPLSRRPQDYTPGDLVAWDLGNGHTHIGIVVDVPGSSGRYDVLHNIGEGPKIEDVLFEWKIIGHYRYFGPSPSPDHSGR